MRRYAGRYADTAVIARLDGAIGNLCRRADALDAAVEPGHDAGLRAHASA